MKNYFRTVAGVAVLALGMSSLAFAGQAGSATDTGSTATSTAKAKHKKKAADSTATTATASAPAAPAAAATAAAPASKPASAKAKSEPINNASDTDIAAAKASGKVWVNTSSGAYHKGGRYYGKTKQGKFMTEDEAKKAGYHEVKSEIGSKKS
jgi:hypothetical protein